MSIRLPEDYWTKMKESCPPWVLDKEPLYKIFFFAGMSACLAMLGEIKESPLDINEQVRLLIEQCRKQIHDNDGIIRGTVQ